ncbi:helix-turn-helix domain-containing protein [Corynebacterium imitans]|uniref:helix-turn-helix domain-containing protein n=1 Tax=Corynebacterium imitans TaxID=156978 RepID=UPI00254A4969|nr:helix-turn-helix domain-containing protein [Corynebacterium imitans]MDK8637506.1 helix-turn-helix domain-containing protein [Corynebacterium imitans]MDK8772068.1 helix-turn-helix domain-containing protein [Corynebacterium imitans]
MKHSKQAVRARTYSVAETAAILGVGKSTLTDHVRNGTAVELSPVRVGRTVRFPMAVIDRLASGDAA